MREQLRSEYSTVAYSRALAHVSLLDATRTIPDMPDMPDMPWRIALLGKGDENVVADGRAVVLAAQRNGAPPRDVKCSM
jgi:hypothetical protein